MYEYEYAPRFPKKKEKTICWILAAVGVVLFVVPSFIPALPYPAILQGFGVIALTAMIMLFSLCVAKHYIYRIEENERGSLDFVITECTGKRRLVVCRVSLSSVLEVIPVTEESKKTFGGRNSGMQRYNYTGILFDESTYYVKLEEDGAAFLVQICATDDLICILNRH